MSSRINYRAYIISPEWQAKHKDFLKRSNYRCAMFPWVKVGKRNRYHCHHMHYNNKGSEQLWVDVIVLCPFAHKFIIHGLLSGFKSTTQQKNYPNTAQRLAHFWCCQPVMVRGGLVVLLLTNLVRVFWVLG